MDPHAPNHRILCAIDTQDAKAAILLAELLKDEIGGVKLGKEFFTANGPSGVKTVAATGLPIFLDLKFHDIPTTVVGAVRAASRLGCFMLTVHTSGGAAMMSAAAEAAAEAGEDDRPLLVGVTVLTSLGEDDMAPIGQIGPIADQVGRLAALGRANGLDGAVASPQEVARLRSELDPDCVLVVPGIRPEWAAPNDQKRVMTPKEAVAAGADYLVIGRPITAADDPVEAARRIAAEIAEA